MSAVKLGFSCGSKVKAFIVGNLKRIHRTRRDLERSAVLNEIRQFAVAQIHGQCSVVLHIEIRIHGSAADKEHINRSASAETAGCKAEGMTVQVDNPLAAPPNISTPVARNIPKQFMLSAFKLTRIPHGINGAVKAVIKRRYSVDRLFNQCILSAMSALFGFEVEIVSVCHIECYGRNIARLIDGFYDKCLLRY